MKSHSRHDTLAHPSFLALDRAHLGMPSSDLAAHLALCEQCRSYVAQPETEASASGFAAVQRALELDRAKARPARWRWALAPALALGCGLLLFVTHRGPSATPIDEVYVGAKGFRSVWIYVKHGADTELWDGKQRLSLGDRVRLKVDPGSYHYLTVYALSDAKEAERLYAGPLAPGQNLTLPDAWEVDESPAAEQLYVVFSDAAITPDWPAWLAGRVPKTITLLPFTLPKAAGADAGLRAP